jgi:hypothetical protein
MATAQSATIRNRAAKDQDSKILARPGEAEPLSDPKYPECRKHDSDRKLERVLGNPRERTMYDKADHDQQAASVRPGSQDQVGLVKGLQR